MKAEEFDKTFDAEIVLVNKNCKYLVDHVMIF